MRHQVSIPVSWLGTGRKSSSLHFTSLPALLTGRSKCRATKQTIEQGALRIGKEIPNPFSDKPGSTITAWYSIEGFLAYIRKGRSGKARPSEASEIEGFDALKASDKAQLVDLLDTVNENEGALAAAEETRLENTEGENNKWWSIAAAGNVTLVKWGQIGDDADPLFSRKEHATEAAAEKFMAQKINEKEKHGYTLEGGGAGTKRKAKPEAKPAAKKAKKKK